MGSQVLVKTTRTKGNAMQWRNDREKQLGVELGFILEPTSRGGRVVNIVLDEKDPENNSPRQGNVRPASMAEVKMWRMLFNAETSV